MKFKFFLPLIFFILIVTLFAFKIKLNDKFESVIDLKSNRLSFLNMKSIITGDEIKLKSNKNKYVILHFFSTRCQECVDELSKLKIFQNEGIFLYGFIIDEERSVVIDWLKKNGNYYEDVFIINSNLYQSMKLNTFPVTFIINSANNEIIEVIAGQIDNQKLKIIISE
ncbi:TlpA family protein disulfide reductase [Candidatus Bandiella numerosa]|uniref:TlpA family protein disulfide reductase n=1 Tax=Candidatus Bandiella numerosa TaxID=2570586 RepID=UPI001F4418FF|nr:redoxin domain-containing protein [Candidatus Bandiella numerosa]